MLKRIVVLIIMARGVQVLKDFLIQLWIRWLDKNRLLSIYLRVCGI